MVLDEAYGEACRGKYDNEYTTPFNGRNTVDEADAGGKLNAADE